MLVSDEWEFDPSMDLTMETGETFPKLQQECDIFGSKPVASGFGDVGLTRVTVLCG